MHLKFFLIVAMLLLVSITGCSQSHKQYRLLDSEYSSYLPQDNLVPFTSYIKENRYRISRALAPLFEKQNPFGTLSLEKVVELRSPREIQPARDCTNQPQNRGHRKGFLFLHGLSDSPFSLKEIETSLLKNFPCAVYRSTVMTGHATVPGDSSKVSYSEWVQLVKYALHQFLGEVDQVYLVGYSTGFTLAIHHLQTEGDSLNLRGEKISIAGVIGLSPALRAGTIAFITPLVKHFFQYLEVYLDENPVQYESFNLNLAAQFYQLSQQIDLEKEIKVPIMMITSSDDQTINPNVNYKFFCNQVKSKNKKMIWYQGLENQLPACPGMKIVPSKNDSYQLINHSHVSIPFSIKNSIYGYQAAYINCLSYYKESISFEECKKKSAPVVYGENNLLDQISLFQGKYYRRGTFNPHYPQMIEEISDFIDTPK